MRTLVLIALTAAGLAAQSSQPVSLSAGFKIGSPINDPGVRHNLFSTYSQSRWTGGPSLELRLPRNFAVEFNALYRNFRENSSFPSQLGPGVNPYTNFSLRKVNVWEFPLLLKYRFQVGGIRPFVSAGHFWNRESSETTALSLCNGPQGSCRPPEFPQDLRGGVFRSTFVQRGVVGGAGIEFRTRYVTIAPELRFSRPTNGYPRENRVTGLVGFSFGKNR